MTPCGLGYVPHIDRQTEIGTWSFGRRRLRSSRCRESATVLWTLRRGIPAFEMLMDTSAIAATNFTESVMSALLASQDSVHKSGRRGSDGAPQALRASVVDIGN